MNIDDIRRALNASPFVSFTLQNPATDTDNFTKLCIDTCTAVNGFRGFIFFVAQQHFGFLFPQRLPFVRQQIKNSLLRNCFYV